MNLEVTSTSQNAVATPKQPSKPVRVEIWQDVKMRFGALLSPPFVDAAWLVKFEAETKALRELIAASPDTALYVLLQTAINEVDHYSAHHAILCAAVTDLCSHWLDWSDAERASVFSAALSMNIAMSAAQDEMARQGADLSEEQRRRVKDHPSQGAALLAAAGVQDPLWLEVVRNHHDPEEMPANPVAQRLCELVHRVDVFAAKLSRRKSRAAASAALAARDACLGRGGTPDAIGATMLRVLGLYPPGIFVRLANNEIAVVTRRGEKAHTPIVVSIRRTDGSPFSVPPQRDTAREAFRIQRGVLASDAMMVLNHTKILSV